VNRAVQDGGWLYRSEPMDPCILQAFRDVGDPCSETR